MNRSLKWKKKFLLCILPVMIIFFAGLILFSRKGEKNPEELFIDVEGEGILQVHFIDVGNADAILLTCDKEAMLVDAGTNQDGRKVVRYLDNLGISTLQYVIGTHPHVDHIGGMDTVLQNKKVKEVILPDVVHTTRAFEDLLDAIEEKNLSITLPKVGEEYSLGSATFTIVGPIPGKEYDKLNNYSVSILVKNGEDRFLLCGDAEKEEEMDMIATGEDLQAQVLKLSHHGSYTATSAAFLDAVDPRWAVISCGESNAYGHPHKSVMKRLEQRGMLIYRTDIQGTIIATSNGKGIVWNQGPAIDFSK